MFGATSLYSYFNKRDLAQFSSLVVMVMGLISVIIASVVNTFLGSFALQFAVSVIGINVFVGLTAWDIQNLKQQYAENHDQDAQQKMAVFGALSLFLNFINIFQLLYYFVDRLKDVIRRRGENISSFALESEVLHIPAIRECAAVAVPSEFSEDDVLIIVTPIEGATIDPVEVTNELTKSLPHFMVPRFVRVLDELPKTASGRVQKHILRSQGVTSDTFDRTVLATGRASA